VDPHTTDEGVVRVAPVLVCKGREVLCERGIRCRRSFGHEALHVEISNQREWEQPFTVARRGQLPRIRSAVRVRVAQSGILAFLSAIQVPAPRT
jgi:hypothetical protein